MRRKGIALFCLEDKSLPWLILTDKEHVVRAEGFSVSELGDKIK